MVLLYFVFVLSVCQSLQTHMCVCGVCVCVCVWCLCVFARGIFQYLAIKSAFKINVI